MAVTRYEAGHIGPVTLQMDVEDLTTEVVGVLYDNPSDKPAYIALEIGTERRSFDLAAATTTEISIPAGTRPFLSLVERIYMGWPGPQRPAAA